MSKKDLFRILIKLCAVYVLIATIINTLPAAIPYLGLLGELSSTDDILFVVVWVIGTLLIVFGLFVWLLKNPDSLILKLKLSEGFDDERIDTAVLSKSNILQLALVIFGGYFFVDSLIYFITNSYAVFYNSINGLTVVADWYDSTQYYCLVSGIQTMAGYLIFWNHVALSEWILNRQKSDVVED